MLIVSMKTINASCSDAKIQQVILKMKVNFLMASLSVKWMIVPCDDLPKSYRTILSIEIFLKIVIQVKYSRHL